MNKFLTSTVWAVLFVACLSPHAWSQDKKTPVAGLEKPLCDAPLSFLADGTCGLAPGKTVDALSVAECKDVQGFEVVDGKCKLDKSKARNPYCSAVVSGLGYDAQTKTCMVHTGNPKSSAGDFEGDCFKIFTPPVGSGLEGGKTYKATAQARVGEDKMLTLYEGKVNPWPVPGVFGCDVTGGVERKVLASAILDTGATRQGWAYGALTMPYKYFRGTKSFVSGTPIGGYLGWRFGTAGSGITAAAALTIGSVKANTVDPATIDPATKRAKVTGNAEVSALAAAGGLMFDVSKLRGAKPFKVGLFVGKDRVNNDPTVYYEHNRRWWTAVQIGYDFTDN